ncbi:MAG: hypothetical protein HN352_15360 [Bacteroidetes bacterium]|jgi:hypothetical protein|nr:hypothetical protein [Bacteroidota bacterium]MBT3749734.1 hypothetical protein [Bacteroidota bacterium]MBT4412233.1 hypothetical protein [Bacteroidota bacterium]MBT5427243.1 hypothetical protein [Bacteroidota bacterium]MBT7464502.1 hypothetical protein [Bacteroidota bacterium]
MKKIFSITLALSAIMSLYSQDAAYFSYSKVDLDKQLADLNKLELLVNSNSGASFNSLVTNGSLSNPEVSLIASSFMNQEKSYFGPALGIAGGTSFIAGCLIGPLWGGLAGGLTGGLYILIVNNELSPQQRNKAISGCIVGTITGAGAAFGLILLGVLSLSY